MWATAGRPRNHGSIPGRRNVIDLSSKASIDRLLGPPSPHTWSRLRITGDVPPLYHTIS